MVQTMKRRKFLCDHDDCNERAKHPLVMAGTYLGVRMCCQHMDKFMHDVGETQPDFEEGFAKFRADHKEQCGYEPPAEPELSEFYLSFATEDEFLGAVVVVSGNFIDAVVRAHALGVNPGGQVASYEFKLGTFAESDQNRLLTKDEAENLEVSK